MKAMREYFQNCHIVYCASDNNEGFLILEENQNTVIYFNQGFSQKETDIFLSDVIIKQKIGFELDNQQINKLYEITNGNCLLLKKFIEAQKFLNNVKQAMNFENKLKIFLRKAHNECEAKVNKFFNDQMAICEETWINNFYKIIFYLDMNLIFPIKLQSFVDRNNIYFEQLETEKTLKSVSQISKLEIWKLYSLRDEEI